MFREGQRKLRFRDFPERVGPRILSLESVDFFGTSEYFGGRKKSNLNKQKTNWSGVVNFHCMQMSLEMGMRFIFGSAMIGMACHVNHFFDIWQLCNLVWNRGP